MTRFYMLVDSRGVGDVGYWVPAWAESLSVTVLTRWHVPNALSSKGSARWTLGSGCGATSRQLSARQFWHSITRCAGSVPVLRSAEESRTCLDQLESLL